jgi:NADH:ubiquinone oxidoreductase subunit F (NADH-binding)
MDKAGALREEILERLDAAGGVTPETVRKIAVETGVPEADVWGAGKFYSLIREPGSRVRVCTGLSCRMAGAGDRIEALEREGEPWEEASCIGQCDRAPAALDPELELIPAEGTGSAVLPNDPGLPVNLGGADSADYTALAQAGAMGIPKVLDAVELSGLQGRGGAGFPAHVKWRAVAGQAEPERYLVCNADEGEPGTFKDREIMERRPHLLLEGLAVAAATVGTSDIIIYIRGEFRNARRSLEGALLEAGDHLKRFNIRFANGHGAYICGEETAACVPFIMDQGGERFRDLGRTGAGTKLYCVSGHVCRPGVYELPLGVTLDELVKTAGGYVGAPIAFSPGGASSGFLPMSLRNLPLDFPSLEREGSMLGSAGVVVMNSTVDLVQAADWQTRFFDDESCGQCAPCRIGARFLRNACGRFLEDGDPDALLHVDDVGWEMEEGSICGLGMVAAKPLISAMRHFPDAFRRRR